MDSTLPPPPPDPAVLSVRIVSIDYYMSPPIPSVDLCYSPLHGREVAEVPVIRIYGSTPVGQKTCLHVHRALPYLYIPCPRELLQNYTEGDKEIRNMMLSIEKALENRSTSAPKRQHIHGYNLVRAKDFYGYHSTEDVFLKIYLYYPSEVARAASLLLGGAVHSRSFQPFESHIPYLLQFLVDYNLFGMGHIHVSQFKFRLPLPDDITSMVANLKKADSGHISLGNSAIWLSSSIPSTLIWSDFDTTQCREGTIRNLVKRQSVCELEADSSVDEIINEKSKIYTSLSQTRSEVKMVQSLIPIWQEYEQSAGQEAAKLPDFIKPCPADVLKSFHEGFEYDSVLLELFEKGEELFPQKFSAIESDEALEDKLFTGFADNISKTLNECTSNPAEETNFDQAMTGSSNQKNLSTEVLGVLSWFASSQAAEDLNSDDELAKEAILTPLFSRRSYEKALEIAHSNYDNVSQQECQDILDSVECLPRSVELKDEDAVAFQGLTDGSISQVDGSPDNDCITPEKFDPFQMNRSVGQKKPLTINDRVGGKQDIKCKKNELLWGSLPLSTSHKERRNLEISFCSLHENLLKDSNEHRTLSGKKQDMSCGILEVDTDQVVSHESKEMTLASCSVRDLMRKKRRFRSEGTESERDSLDSLVDKENTEKRCSPLDVALCNMTPDTLCEGSAHVLLNIVSSAAAEEHVALRDDNEYMSTSGTISQQGYHETQDSSYAESDSILDKNSPQGWKSGNSQSNIGYKTCKTLLSQVGSMEMRFKWKPPSNDEMLRILGNSPADCQSIGDLRPFFQRNFGHTESCELMHVDELDSRRDLSLLPTHFQNDGSVLYLLTHATATPSFDSVHRWIAEDSKVMSNLPTGDSKNFPPSDCFPISRDMFEDNGRKNEPLIQTGVSYHPVTLPQDSCHNTPEDYKDFHLKQVQSSSSQEKEMSLLIETSSCYVPVSKGKPPTVGTDTGASSWHDISQISGPYQKLNLTPLSQSGFRDPAGAGCGQQLTLISLEVQAESRGDLRPDPQYDAVNIIALAVQEDANPATEIFVLMRDNNENQQKKYIDGIVDCSILVCYDEKQLLNQFINIISSVDPDILMGWEIQGGSLGFLAERSAHLGINLLKSISRTSLSEAKQNNDNSKSLESVDEIHDTSIADGVCELVVIDDEWGRNYASGLHVGGRIVLNMWRLVRSEVKLNMYSFEAVVEEVLRRKIPSIPSKVLNLWFSSGPGQVRYRCIEYITERAKLNVQILNQLDLINRTSELARIFGIDFFSVLSRGSQFRVESMLLRLAHTQNYLAISPGSQQVALQPAMECLPLVMEPESRFYVDPVVVLDFQSLYPSMIIAYNLCFSTCLGKVFPSRSNVLGVSSYSADPHLLKNLREQLLLTPNGVAYVPPKVRQGVLPRLLEEILSTRIMIKQAMKKLLPSQKVLERIFNARQLALKLIANVTYGYTAAGFSGRMPCAEIADSIVQCGRRTLENAISFVNKHPKWHARVVYGDTDSMFVLLRGRTLEAAFEIGNEIASAITAMNPTPVTLKMEKVYQPCFLLTKKRYVGYSYQSPDQGKATFDAKGIETVRRDTCPAVAKILEQSLRLMFEYQDTSRVKSYLQRQWTRILSGKVTLQDFVFAKEVRLGTYSERTSSLPPAAIVAMKAMNVDPRAEPRYGERVPYVVIHGEPGARLIDMVVDPYVLLDIHSHYRLNDLYYINKQIIPALQRVFGLLGVDLNQWFKEMPRPARAALPNHSHKFHLGSIQDYDDRRLATPKKIHVKNRIDTYYASKHCIVCGELVEKTYHLCDTCKEKKSLVATVLIGRTSKLEREIQHLAAEMFGELPKHSRRANSLSYQKVCIPLFSPHVSIINLSVFPMDYVIQICRHCGGGDWVLESGVQCTSLACSVFFERRKVQKALLAISPLAHETESYPRCRAEWF